MALDEHKQKGTRPGDRVYQIIHDQLAEDLAPYGFGRDQLRDVAEKCGQLSTYERLEQLMTRQSQPQESTAIGLLNEQLQKLDSVRTLDYRDPKFIAWRNTTTNLLQRSLRPDSAHLITFLEIRYQRRPKRLPFNYRGPLPSETTTPADREIFERACAIAEESIKGAIKEIRDFGVYSGGAEMPTSQKRGGVQQTFLGPVVIQSQAIATDSAIQNIGQMGNVGANLREIANLLGQSMDLTGREKLDGLKAIEVIDSETQKQESRRNWRSIMNWGEKPVSIAEKLLIWQRNWLPTSPQSIP